MGKKMKHSLMLLMALLIMALAGSITAFAYTTVEDDGNRSTRNDSSMHVIYSTAGMLRIQDEGTTVTLSGDKVNVSATTANSKTWGGITKIAFTEDTATDAEKDAAANDIVFDSTESSKEALSRKISFSIPVTDIGKKIPVCRYTDGEWKPFTSQAYYIVLMTDDLYDQISAACESATGDTKNKLEEVLKTAELSIDKDNNYMFSPEKLTLVENKNGFLLRIVYGKATYSKAFLGYVSQALIDDSAALSFEGDDGKIEIPFDEVNTEIPIAFKSASKGYSANRVMSVNKLNKTVYFKHIENDPCADSKEEVLKELETAYSADNYSGDEKTQIEKILADAKTAIEAAATAEAVEAAKTTAQEAAAAVKTDAVKKEEAAAAKAAAEKAAKEKAAKEKAAKIAAAKKVKVTIKAPKKASKAFTANWKAVKKVTGYKVSYALDKKFKKSVKTKTVKGAAKKSLKIKSLKKKKTYYVRVRAYTVIDGKTYNGKWSAVKKVTTK